MATKKTTAPKKKTGAPSKYSKALADQICELIKQGKSEREIGKMKDMPSASTISRWKDQYPSFCERSARARQQSAIVFRMMALEIAKATDKTAEDVIKGKAFTVSGNPILELPKGYVEAKKLYIQELNREAGIRDDSNFGDRKRVALTGADGGPVKVEEKTDLNGLSLDDLKTIREILYAKRDKDTDSN